MYFCIVLQLQFQSYETIYLFIISSMISKEIFHKFYKEMFREREIIP